METTKEANQSIVETLRKADISQILQYAALRIEELEAENKDLRIQLSKGDCDCKPNEYCDKCGKYMLP
jgi:NADH/NAD ratio-sensing transcriptional regulator Rex